MSALTVVHSPLCYCHQHTLSERAEAARNCDKLAAINEVCKEARLNSDRMSDEQERAETQASSGFQTPVPKTASEPPAAVPIACVPEVPAPVSTTEYPLAVTIVQTIDGIVYKNELFKGKLHGVCTQEKDGSPIRVIHYKYGVKQGVSEHLDAGEIIRKSTTFTGGVKTGPFSTHYSNGKYKIDAMYLKGKLHTIVEGGLVKDGYYREYLSDGTLIEKSIFHEGKRNGLCTKYWTNGKLKFTTEYKNDKIHGRCRQYNENGVLTSDNIVVNGDITSRGVI